MNSSNKIKEITKKLYANNERKIFAFCIKINRNIDEHAVLLKLVG